MVWALPLAISLAALAGVLLTLGPGAGGPGVTVDEYYDSLAGRRIVEAVGRRGWQFFNRQSIAETFGPLTLHPPLGRLCLGLAAVGLGPPADDPAFVALAAARVAPAVGFAVLVFAAGVMAGRIGGPVAAAVASAASAMSPNLFGHAHFATLDTLTALFSLLALWVLGWALARGERRGPYLAAGAVWGLALLTKFHGLTLLVPAAGACAWHLRRRMAVPFALWLAAGGATFWIGWPWLWLEPWQHLQRYLTSATSRASLHVFYLGKAYRDIDVPWHYPWVMMAVTLPLGVLLLGLYGLPELIRRGGRDPRAMLVLAGLATALGVFSLPAAPVYDGVRLFLLAIPLWSISAGLGMARLLEAAPQRWPGRKWRLLAGSGLVAAQGVGLWLYAPCYVSHYGAQVGGLAGAVWLGFEATYWGDSLEDRLLETAARHADGSPMVYAPQLAPFQAAAVAAASPALSRQRVELVGWNPDRPETVRGCRYALVYHRRADLESVEPLLRGATVSAEVSRRGVWLARLYRLAAAGPAQPVPP